MRALWSALVVAVGCGGTATTGGSGGAGAAGGGGGAGGSSGATVEQMIDTFCARVTTLGCGGYDSESTCRIEGQTALDQATVAGCSVEFEATLRCATSQPISCEQPPEVLCPVQVDELQRCTSGGTCEMSGGGGPEGTTCDVTCPDYSAECTQPTGSTADCLCTSGLRAGQRYVASTCDSGLTVAEGACR
jgi:hypothetical protein